MNTYAYYDWDNIHLNNPNIALLFHNIHNDQDISPYQLYYHIFDMYHWSFDNFINILNSYYYLCILYNVHYIVDKRRYWNWSRNIISGIADKLWNCSIICNWFCRVGMLAKEMRYWKYPKDILRNNWNRNSKENKSEDIGCWSCPNADNGSKVNRKMKSSLVRSRWSSRRCIYCLGGGSCRYKGDNMKTRRYKYSILFNKESIVLTVDQDRFVVNIDIIAYHVSNRTLPHN